MSERSKLSTFLKEVINWRWDEFVKAESDPQYTGLQATVLSLVRTTSEGKLGAIKLSIDRVDGKIATPVNFVYPKVWYIYPEATGIAELPAGSTTTETAVALPEPEVEHERVERKEDEPESAVTLSLRETLNKMAEKPRVLIKVILKRKIETERALADGTPMDDKTIPLVKSVIAANLLHLAGNNNFEAITEVFDQIDGKLVETIHVLGDDIYLANYALEAPAGAIKNSEGIYMIEAKEIAEQWKQRLKAK